MLRFVLFSAITLLLGCTPQFADEKKPDGKEIKPLLVMSGHKSKIEDASCQRITATEDWKKLWAKHQTGSADLKGLPRDFNYTDFDFDQVAIIAMFDGVQDSVGYGGYRLHSIRNTGDRIVVRVEQVHLQTGFLDRDTSAESLDEKQARFNTDWMVVLLPRSSKEIVVEVDSNVRVESQHEWTELKRFPVLSK